VKCRRNGGSSASANGNNLDETANVSASSINGNGINQWQYINEINNVALDNENDVKNGVMKYQCENNGGVSLKMAICRRWHQLNIKCNQRLSYGENVSWRK
jgi:hypothetical protein